MRITILGPAWPYRGGIAAFSERLAHQLLAEGNEVKLYTYTLQYPGFLFPGKTQYSAEPKPADLDIERCLSSVNPLTWISLGRRIRKEQPDLLVIAYWMGVMAPSSGTVARIAKGNGKTRVVLLCHNLLPHEPHPWDGMLAKYMLGSVDCVLSLSKSVCEQTNRMKPGMPARFSPHPLYDNLGEPVSRAEGLKHIGLNPEQRYFLFFGLIREYKGLDWLLEAYAKLQASAGGHGISVPRLLVVGEFYSGSERYHKLAQDLGIDDKVTWKSEFVPDSEVKYYFAAADLIVQPYKSATQSGVTQIAYQFEKPMLVTNVGGLSEIVPDGKVGYVVEPNADAVAAGMLRFLNDKPDFTTGILEEKRKYQWSEMTKALMSLY